MGDVKLPGLVMVRAKFMGDFDGGFEPLKNEPDNSTKSEDKEKGNRREKVFVKIPREKNVYI